MKNLPLILLSIFSLAIVFSCVKEKYELDENITVPDLDPIFGAPLVYTSLNLDDLEQNLDYQNFIYSQNDEVFAFVYNQEIIDYEIGDLFDIPEQSVAYSYEIDATSADEVNALPTGFTTSYTVTETQYITMNNSEELDSVILDIASINFNASSQINQDLEIVVTMPTLQLDGVPYTTTQNFDYSGTLPVDIFLNSDISGYTLDLTNGGTETNAIPIVFDITFTKTDESVSDGDAIAMEFNFLLDNFHSIYGYFGQSVNIIDQDSQRIEFFENLGDGNIYFADPSINLTIYNQVGMDVEIDFNSILAPDNSSTIGLGGPDLTDLPLITGANFLGDESITLHTIDNSGTSPMLSDLLDEGPSTIVYEASALTNPDGFASNFAHDTSSIKINAEVVLPLFLYANNFTYTDTLDVDLASELQLDSIDDPINEDDIKSITLRLIADNGLPVDVGTQVYIADSMNNIVDSLFATSGNLNIFQSGLVNFSLDITDPNYGKVYQSKRTITDITLDQDMIQNIKNTQANKIIFRASALTSNAGNGDFVKFFPEYTLDLKLSARIETNIDLSN